MARKLLMLMVCGVVTALMVSGCDTGGGGGAPAPSALSGTVTDPSHAVVANANVVLVPAADVEAIDSLQPLEDLATQADAKGYPTATTDANGQFSLSNVADGDYFLVVLPTDANHLPGAKREAITIASGAVTAQLRANGGGGLDMAISQTPSSAATYVGSETCLGCHPGKDGVKHTLHFVGFRVPGQWNSLQDEAGLQAVYPDKTFNEALDSFTNPGTCITVAAGSETKYAFLSKDDNGNYWWQMANDSDCSVKSDKYKMAFTYGGEGLAKQRFMLLVGKDGNGTTDGTTPVTHVQATTGSQDAYYYAAPFQFNETHASANNPAKFEKDGESWAQWLAPTTEGQAIFVDDKSGDIAHVGNGTEEQFATDCAGCHGGVQVTKDTKGNFITQYIDQIDSNVFTGNIGCERCHGPGSEHVAAGGNGQNIVVPSYLTPGRAMMVCGACHQRKMDPGGGGKIAADEYTKFPAIGDVTTGGTITVFVAGMSPDQYYDVTDTSVLLPDFGDDHVGPNTYFHPINYATDGHSWQDKQFGAMFNHSKGHHQQYFDMARTVMFRNDRETLVCFSCHDAHGSDHEHQLIYDPDNNALCLDCHNGSEVTKGGFDTITRAMVDDLQATGNADPAIGTAVEGHMLNFAGMQASYDPEGSGVGRCTKCHMPETAKTARWHDMSNGWREGDIHSHTFDVMSVDAITAMFNAVNGDPTLVTPAGFTNACGVCHVGFLPPLP